MDEFSAQEYRDSDNALMVRIGETRNHLRAGRRFWRFDVVGLIDYEQDQVAVYLVEIVRADATDTIDVVLPVYPGARTGRINDVPVHEGGYGRNLVPLHDLTREQQLEITNLKESGYLIVLPRTSVDVSLVEREISRLEERESNVKA